MTLRVLHLTGSAVSDFYDDLSRLYAADALTALANPARYEFHVAHVSPGGLWRFPADLSGAALAAAPPMPLADAVAVIDRMQVEVMVPQMFCIPGMTSYRALFDLLAVPYLGQPPDLMAVTADKAITKAIVAAAGVQVPAGELLRRGERPTAEPPVVIKPVDADNSLGVALVRDRADYDSALAAAFAHTDRVLVEPYVELGREVRCGVIERDGELVPLPLEEYSVDPVTKPVRGYDDKIDRGADGDLGLVAKDATHAWTVDVADPLTERVWAVARTCHRALGARHYSLFDFRIDPEGGIWFLEAGLYCSFAKQSVIATMAAAAGIDVVELFDTALRAALPDRKAW